jgi:cysteinyl-tRNA synthetase
LIAKGYTGREIRYALMRVDYRKPLNFTWEGMKEARESLGRIDDWLERLEKCSGASEAADRLESKPEDLPFTFEEAMDDDLNISAALGFLFESIRETNRAMDKNELVPATAKEWLDWWNRINRVLQLQKDEAAVIPAEIAEMVEGRRTARLNKEWQKSDELRDKLAALGWEVRDTKDGQTVKRIGASG